MSFSENLRNLRIEKGLSQKALAKAAGVSQTAVYHWEKGIRTPKIGQVRNISSALGVTMSALIDDWSMFSTGDFKEDWSTKETDELEISLEMAAEYSSQVREKKLIDNFRKLNSLGQDKSIDYVEDLVTIKKYTDTPD